MANQATFVDSTGVEWHRRGDQRLTGKELARRLRDTDLVVLHEYMEETVLVQPADRQSFWAAAEQRMRDSVHADFYGVEFKSDSHTGSSSSTRTADQLSHHHRNAIGTRPLVPARRAARMGP